MYQVLIIIISVIAVLMGIAVYNFFTAPELENVETDKRISETFLSILIPARNEEKSIALLLESILHQSFTNYEVYVLDDTSTDNTYHIVTTYAKRDGRIRVIKGKPLPPGWSGKNWACWQLSQKANAPVILFLDSDVILHRNALLLALSEFRKTNIGLLSLFPTMPIKKLYDLILVPLIHVILLALLPVALIYKHKDFRFSAAYGVFMMFDKDLYFKIGGHEKVAGINVEDIKLARNVKRNGYKEKMLLAVDYVKTDAYDSFRATFLGMSRSFYRGSELHPVLFLFCLTGFMLSLFLPFILVFFNTAFLIPIIMILIMRAFISYKVKQSIFINTLLHPLQIVILYGMGVHSLYTSLTHTVTWRGRRV